MGQEYGKRGIQGGCLLLFGNKESGIKDEGRRMKKEGILFSLTKVLDSCLAEYYILNSQLCEVWTFTNRKSIICFTQTKGCT
jgi:hypothetical protein